MTDIKNMIDNALQAQTTPAKAVFATPEDYKNSTGKRFRLTKAEIASFGSDEAGRLKAFLERQDKGLL